MSAVDVIPYSSFLIFILVGVFIAASKLPTRQVVIISAALIATGLLGLFAYLFWLGPKYRNAGETSAIVFYKGPKGNVVLVQSVTSIAFRGASEGYERLAVVDAGSGKILSTQLAGSPAYHGSALDLMAVLDDKVWYHSYDDGLHARDPYTGAVMVNEKQIISKYPALQGVSRASVKTDEGYIFESAPPDFQLKMDSFPVNKVNSSETSFQKYKEEYPLNYEELKVKDYRKMLINSDPSYTALFWTDKIAALDGDNGYCLKPSAKGDQDVTQLFHAHGTRYHYEPDSSVNTQLEFRNGVIIENYWLPNPPSVLIGHDGFNKDREVSFRLSRIDLSGKVVWELTEEEIGGRPNIFSLHEGILYLGVNGTLVAIDAGTGAKRWTTQL